MTETRVSTGVAGLDEMLRGGLLPGSVTLVRGAPGVGKTSLAFQFLVAGAQNGEPGLFITFEEFPHALHRDAESLGFDLRAMEAEGKLHLVFTSPGVLLNSLQDPESPIHKLIVDRGVRRAAIDSMTHFTRLTENPQDLRHIYATTVNGLRREQITTLLLSEEHRSEYHRTDRGGLAYLSDGVILLRYVEIESTIERAVIVLKLRGSDHAREIRHYDIREGGLVVGEVFRRRGAILSGISRRD
jgi:circadian clock protein KaiC